MSKANPFSVTQSWVINSLHIYTVFALAVAYPVYLFLRTNPAYILANGVTPKLVYGIIALVSLLFPTALILCPLGIRYFSKRAHIWSHRILFAFLVGLLFIPLISRAESIPFTVILLLTIAVSVLVAHQCMTNKFTYIGIAVIAPVTFLLPLQFTNDHNINQILNPQTVDSFVWETENPEDLPPIVMIVFDEFPLVHLLDKDGNIDKKRFPNFGLLASESTWYSNATTVHDITLKSVPAILTGRYPMPGKTLPLPENYPNSLFDVLRANYELHVRESATNLSGSDDSTGQGREINLGALTSDLGIFYVRSLLPAKIADRLLPIEDGIWGGFLARLPHLRHETQSTLYEWQDNKNKSLKIKHRFFAADQFIKEFQSYPPNTFHLLHTILPHHPYQFLPTARVYNFSPGTKISQAEILNRKLGAHILQVGLTDGLLGMIRSELKRLKQYDDCMFIVVADHGVAFREEVNGRLISQENVGEVGFVPLLIKYPHQKEGRIDDSNVQTVDIAPTIFDILNIANSPENDGRSLLDDNAFIPDSKIIMSEDDSTIEVSLENYLRRRQEAHQHAIEFFSLKDPRSDLFAYGPGLNYIGEKLSSLKPHAIPCTIESDGPAKFRNINFMSHEIQALLVGTITFRQKPIPQDAVLAISINGTVKAVTKPYAAYGKMQFHKVLSDRYFKSGENDLELLLLPTPNPGTSDH